MVTLTVYVINYRTYVQTALSNNIRTLIKVHENIYIWFHISKNVYQLVNDIENILLTGRGRPSFLTALFCLQNDSGVRFKN